MGCFGKSPRRSHQRGVRKSLNSLFRISSLPFLSLFALACVVVVDRWESSAVGQQPGYGAPAGGQNKPPVTSVKSSPLDEPIRLMTEAARTYQQVKDYTCTMVKQENINGKLQPEHIIFMKFRVQPFSVYMQWMAPKNMATQEVAYIHGRNNNMMRVKMPGLVGKIGFISIAPNDPRALEHSRHTIVEAGIGNVIATCLNSWQQERNFNRSKVTINEYEYDKKRCYRIEVAMLEKSSDAYCYRTVVYLDKQTYLPVRAECYNWPQAGGPPQGELLEAYSYANMQFNVGLTEKDFAY